MLRNDLNVYLRILQSAMIELINKDYADFVNLSTNLVRDLVLISLKNICLAVIVQLNCLLTVCAAANPSIRYLSVTFARCSKLMVAAPVINSLFYIVLEKVCFVNVGHPH